MVFEKLISFQIEYAPQYHLTKYVSSRTRMQLVHINSKSSPLVQGYFVVGTECCNDSGVPHTLEHLIFMGSQRYPRKGLLDTAGGITMSTTNAYTASDHTAYELVSAGWLGFKKLLPVYLDHLLHPTLTEHAFTTEVYHLDPNDLTDKGVVYSEMEAREHESSDVAILEKGRQMFPEGNGYRSEVGGLTKHLRTLTNAEVRAFHAEMYTPDNICLVICGNVPEHELLQIVEEFDAELPEKTGPRRRPFVDSASSQIPPRLPKSIESTVPFPELDESRGEIYVSWIGSAYDDQVNDLAVSLLLDYLTESSLAPLNKQLIEIDSPLATCVGYWTDDYMRTIINLFVMGVPTARLQEAKQKCFEIMSAETIDLERIRQVVENSRWDYVLKCERDGASFLAHACISDFLYGDEEGQLLKKSLRDLSDFDALATWSQEQWQSLYASIFIENPSVTVLVKPSAALYQQHKDEQEALLQERKASYSEEQRDELRSKFDDAQFYNNLPIEKEVLDKFVIENPAASVEFIQTKSISTIEHEDNDLQDELTMKIISSRPKDFPLFMHFEHFPSQFVEVNFLVNSRVVKDHTLLPYYYIFRELFKMPMNGEDGTLIGHEEVIKQLKDETIENKITLGLHSQFDDLIHFKIQSKASDYGNAVKWIKHCLYDMVFQESRVSVLLERFLNSIVEKKRSGPIMKSSLMNRYLYSDNSLCKATDVLYVENILQDILTAIEDGKFESEVLPRIELFRDQLRSHFHKFHILILGDIEKLGDVYKPWEQLVNQLPMDKSQVVIPPTPRLLETVSEFGSNPKELAYIITTPGSSSSYMTCLASVPINLDYQHRDLPAITLASEYLQCVEGPFWKGIRGSGLAYGTALDNKLEENAVSFTVYRGTDIIKCYETAKRIVESYADGSMEFDEQLIHGAVSSIINSIASTESGYFDAAARKYIDNFCKRRGPDYNTKLLTKLSTVTAEDMRSVMGKYFVNMFNPGSGAVFVSCHPSKLELVQCFLESQGYRVIVEELEDDDADDSASASDCDSE
ncbi:AFR334Wp [Eremothecium gossypii ATCC 10895]|uniref:AFR334Wp n=1 Tax=Eremothecium gossypii (strain ATCC 10895 / CBS 109.51 / FGSC 9923 / NRRL Y-1056) TaxID=284811 RepID=Q753H8_EREGS|nr:AFR334Wp [Eremothecium gossypii ATCC 10895]AAS53705.1 AFR334Wp [Eremothecium gossypii ATCC 10895]